MALILSAIANFLSLLGMDHIVKQVFWGLYALAALIVGVAFNRGLPRNPGFIMLAAFLILSGINNALLTFDSDYPDYYFVFSGIPALISGIYFVWQRETWRDMGFLMLSGYLITHGLANLLLSIISSEAYSGITVIESIFSILAAFFFFMRKQTV